MEKERKKERKKTKATRKKNPAAAGSDQTPQRPQAGAPMSVYCPVSRRNLSYSSSSVSV